MMVGMVVQTLIIHLWTHIIIVCDVHWRMRNLILAYCYDRASSNTIKGRMCARLKLVMMGSTDEPQTEEESEFLQENSCEEANIISQSWLMKQVQWIKFHGFLPDDLTNITNQLVGKRIELNPYLQSGKKYGEGDGIIPNQAFDRRRPNFHYFNIFVHFIFIFSFFFFRNMNMEAK